MGPRESNPDSLSCRFCGREAISQATEAAREFGHLLGLADDDLARLCIVIEELVANLYDHGRVSDLDVVELSLARDPGGIRASIVDPGRPFNPWLDGQAIDRSDRDGGGGGIDLVRAWAQFISYRTSNEGNRLEFLLPVRGQD